MSGKAKFFLRAQADGSAELGLYGPIGWEIGAAEIRRRLKEMGDVSSIDVHIHSEGGDVLDGLAIYNLLTSHPAKIITHVDGMALSMASVVAMAGDQIEMADHSWMMIHNPMSGAYGDGDDLHHQARLLDALKEDLVDIYAKRTGRDPAEIEGLMDEETWLSAADACRLGFADRTSSQPALAASFDASRFTNVPHEFLAGVPAMNEIVESAAPEPLPATEALRDPAPPQNGHAGDFAEDAAAVDKKIEAAIGIPREKTGKDFLNAFGPQGAVWFVEGKTWDEAQSLHVEGLQGRIDELTEKLKAVAFGQPEPVSATDPLMDETKPSTPRSLNAALGGNIARVAAGIRLPKLSSN